MTSRTHNFHTGRSWCNFMLLHSSSDFINNNNLNTICCVHTCSRPWWTWLVLTCCLPLWFVIFSVSDNCTNIHVCPFCTTLNCHSHSRHTPLQPACNHWTHGGGKKTYGSIRRQTPVTAVARGKGSAGDTNDHHGSQRVNSQSYHSSLLWFKWKLVTSYKGFLFSMWTPVHLKLKPWHDG
jgi:hypothetical protein